MRKSIKIAVIIDTDNEGKLKIGKKMEGNLNPLEAIGIYNLFIQEELEKIKMGKLI